MGDLSDLTSKCIRCGFCIESCPTFVLDGDESRSPRGRIGLAQLAEDRQIDWEETRNSFETCLGCRACETACPSGVEYGKILEQAKVHLAPNSARRALLQALSNPSTARALAQLGSATGAKIPKLAGISRQKQEAVPPRIQDLPDWPPLTNVPKVVGEVYLLSGCVAGTIFPCVEQAVRRLLRRVGFVVKTAPVVCCGALLEHGGLSAEAKDKAEELAAAFAGQEPIIVHTAGCGSTLKEYAHFGYPELASRVWDISQFLEAHGLVNHLRESAGVLATATYHDACHLAHGQKIRSQPRALLAAIPGLELVALPESDMCCGSAGTYNLFEPGSARRLLERKWRNIESTGAQIVIQGNAGCHAWIEQAAREHGGRVLVMHLAEVLEASFSGLP